MSQPTTDQPIALYIIEKGIISQSNHPIVFTMFAQVKAVKAFFANEKEMESKNDRLGSQSR